MGSRPSSSSSLPDAVGGSSNADAAAVVAPVPSPYASHSCPTPDRFFFLLTQDAASLVARLFVCARRPSSDAIPHDASTADSFLGDGIKKPQR